MVISIVEEMLGEVREEGMEDIGVVVERNENGSGVSLVRCM